MASRASGFPPGPRRPAAVTARSTGRRPSGGFRRHRAGRGRSACRGPASFPTRFPVVSAVALHVEQVVGHLEGQAEGGRVLVDGGRIVSVPQRRWPRGEAHCGSAPRSSAGESLRGRRPWRGRLAADPAFAARSRTSAHRPCPPAPAPRRQLQATNRGHAVRHNCRPAISNAAVSRASPARMASGVVELLVAGRRPRRRSSSSIAGRSSWISEYVCTISTATAGRQGLFGGPADGLGGEYGEQRSESLARGEQAVRHRLGERPRAVPGDPRQARAKAPFRRPPAGVSGRPKSHRTTTLPTFVGVGCSTF